MVVTAGSIGPDMRDAFAGYFQPSVRAIQALGARSLVIGPADSANFGASDDVMALPFVPYSLVFPHAAVVIHHGGIGTTAQTLRYGAPSLIVPWGVDQFFSASQIAHLGAGRSLLWRNYSVLKAQTALKALLEDARYREKAQVAQTMIAQEDGVATLCDAILAML